MAERRVITIEVAYALPQNQRIVELEVEYGTSARQAVLASQMNKHFPELQLSCNALGIFGEHVDDDAVLEEGDRVELYRPLLVDPKELRRQRALESLTTRASKRG